MKVVTYSPARDSLKSVLDLLVRSYLSRFSLGFCLLIKQLLLGNILQYSELDWVQLDLDRK